MDIQKVTTPTEKTKAPGRVAWGKKLAEMRRQKKSNTQLTQSAKLHAPSAQVEPKITTSHGSESSSSTQTLIGLGCLALGTGALYYQYRTYWRSPTGYQSHASPTPVAQVIDKAKDDNPLPQDDKAIPKPSLKSRLADMM